MKPRKTHGYKPSDAVVATTWCGRPVGPWPYNDVDSVSVFVDPAFITCKICLDHAIRLRMFVRMNAQS